MANEQDEQGCVLWLPDNANALDREVWKVSGLNDGARDHPVLVVMVYGHGSQKHYVVLVCTGTFNAKYGDLPISHHSPNHVVSCGECRDLRSDVPLLSYTSSARQPKHTHVQTRQAYLVSDVMVREQRATISKQHYKLDQKSFQVIRGKSAKAVQDLLARLRLKGILEELLSSQQGSVQDTTPPSSEQDSYPASAEASQPATDVALQTPIPTESTSSSPSESNETPEQTESETTSAIAPGAVTRSLPPKSLFDEEDYIPYDCEVM